MTLLSSASLLNVAIVGRPSTVKLHVDAVAEVCVLLDVHAPQWRGTDARVETTSAVATTALQGIVHTVARAEFLAVADSTDSIGLNQAPIWGSAAGVVFDLQQGTTLDMRFGTRFTDPENDPLVILQNSGALPAGVTYDPNTKLLTAALSAPTGQSEDLTFSADDGHGTVLNVGPGKQYTTVRAALLAVQDDNIIQIDPGDYIADVGTLAANNVTIRGTSTVNRARLFANSLNQSGKGIIVLTGDDCTFENMEFHDATVPDSNGAGVRHDGGGFTTFRNCKFFDCENGILSGGGGEVLMELCEFGRNGFGDGFTHNCYFGQHLKVTARDCYFHEAHVGHEFKSRAKENILERCYFVNGPTGDASYLVNADNGGSLVMRGCMLQKSTNADNGNTIFHNSNTWGAGFNSILLEHCTLVHEYPSGSFINLASSTTAVTLRACLFASNGRPLVTGATPTQDSNFHTTVNKIPNASNISDPDFWPDISIYSSLGLSSAVVPTYLIDAPNVFEQRVLSSPPTVIGSVQNSLFTASDYWVVPSLQDEKDYYALTNKPGGAWAWTASDLNFVGFPSSPDPLPLFNISQLYIHADWESCTLAAWQWQTTRGYMDPAQISSATQREIPRLNRDRWLDFMKNKYLPQLQINDGLGDWTNASGDLCHIFLHGLCLVGVEMGDSAAITVAENIMDYVLPLMRTRHGATWPVVGVTSTSRPASRQLISLCHLVQATGKQKWIDERDQYLDAYMAAPNWADGPSLGLVSGCGAYFRNRSEMANDGWHVTVADYDAGGRCNPAIYTALEAEALWYCWLQTARDDVRTRIVQYGRYMQNYAHHPSPAPYPLCGYVWGVKNGVVWKCGGGINPNNGSTYTPWVDGNGSGNCGYDAEVVNGLVRAYRFTGDTTLLDRAKVHHRQCTRWAEGSPNGNPSTSVPLNEVRVFTDTNYQSSTVYYFSYDKGQLQHVSEIFGNGGNPTVIP